LSPPHKKAAPARERLLSFSDHHHEITFMDILAGGAANNALERERLPNRRCCQTIAFERDGSQYQMTVGFYPDGRPGEIFLNHNRSDSLLDVLTSDAAILASLALQHGCTIETIALALKRDARGTAASPIGAAVDQIT
jgi:hypothetical protein